MFINRKFRIALFPLTNKSIKNEENKSGVIPNQFNSCCTYEE